MVSMKPRPEFVQYRENVPQWRIWNVTNKPFPPFALVAMGRDQGPRGEESGFQNVIDIARTAGAIHGTYDRHKRDVTIDQQITYEAYSGPIANWGVLVADPDIPDTFNAIGGFERGPSNPVEISESGLFVPGKHMGWSIPPGFTFAQAPESYLALFEIGLDSDRMGLSTQHWPVLTRFVGDVEDIAEAWPRYAVADLDNFGVKLHEDGPFQIMSVHPNALPDSELVWIAPRHIAFRDAWAVGEIEEVIGTGEAQELKGATVAVNSPGGDDILTISDGRIISHKLGVYRVTLTAIVQGDPPNHDGTGKLPWFSNANEGVATGNYGWLPQGTEETSSHSHGISVSGGAGSNRLWDRTTSTVTYTKHVANRTLDDIPRDMKVFWNGSTGEKASRIRYFVEYLRPTN